MAEVRKMSAISVERPSEDGLVRIPMTWEEYLAADVVPSDYYDGAMVVMNRPRRTHQEIARRLEDALRATAPEGVEVIREWGWSPAGVKEELGPDLMAFPQTDEDLRFSGVPFLVVEVLSGNRRDDLVAKLNRYAAWGAPDYWIVDPRDRVVITLRNDSGTFTETGRFTDGDVTLRYGAVEVPVDLDALFG
ncbi:Uma2 family endonuclease [Nocardioides sp.]|uniref:Uma2 family endonuclease n=1 Tax=Nocardioides sp. TaxID=35761 RepID=UPI0039E64961